MVGWHRRLDGHGFGQCLGDGDRQGSLALQSMGLQRVGHDLVTEKPRQIVTPLLQMRKMGFGELGKLVRDQCPSH